MNKQLNELISKELSRKEFLQFVGGGIIVLLGMNNFISYLSRFKASGKPSLTVESQNNGFGSRKFGG